MADDYILVQTKFFPSDRRAEKSIQDVGRRLKRRGTWPGIAAINKYYSATSCRYQATPHSQSLIDRKCYNCQHLAKQCPNALYCEGVVSDGVVGKGCVVKQGVVSEGVW